MISPKLHFALRHFPGLGDEFFLRGIAESFFEIQPEGRVKHLPRQCGHAAGQSELILAPRHSLKSGLSAATSMPLGPRSTTAATPRLLRTIPWVPVVEGNQMY